MAVVSDDQGPGKAPEYTPYVPEETDLKELTFKAVFIGVIMAVILGSANAYLGLKAGITVAATFPAAVVGMATLRMFKGSILEENVARTTGAVGEALAAGAIFTIPAFVIAGVPGWEKIDYIQATILMVVGGLLGAMFVILLRRTLVEESGLPFPESVAAAEIHKAGQGGGTGAGFVFGAMGLSALIELFKNSKGLTAFKNYEAFANLTPGAGTIQLYPDVSTGKGVAEVSISSGFLFESPAASPAMWGVGYIIGPRLASITFSGGLLGWGLFVPLVMMFCPELLNYIGKPEILEAASRSGESENIFLAKGIWTYVVRPFAVGSMLVGAAFTLYNMRKQLATGIGRAVSDLMKSGEKVQLKRTQTDLPFSLIFGVIGIIVIVMSVIYYFFSHDLIAAIASAVVMTISGFFFAAVAGYLVGLIGSSNNPISGLTLSTLIIAAVLLVALGVPARLIEANPDTGALAAVAAVLGVASVICCSCGVAGDMMQDLKVGHILGGTPWKMEVGKLIGVVVAGLVMALPLILLHEAYADTGGIGGTDLPAPQAGLMAMLSKGIIGGDMNWPLVILGMVFAVGLILIKSPSPMLIAIGMYLPLHTTFAIFTGGVIRFILDKLNAKKEMDTTTKALGENTGVLLASGLIAGEALMAICLAGFNFVEGFQLPKLVEDPQAWPGLIPLVIVAAILIYFPIKAMSGAKKA